MSRHGRCRRRRDRRVCEELERQFGTRVTMRSACWAICVTMLTGVVFGSQVTMLELRDVSKRFIGALAVDRVPFRARAGEVTGYLGPNGSRKSKGVRRPL